MKNIAVYIRVICILTCVTAALGAVLVVVSQYQERQVFQAANAQPVLQDDAQQTPEAVLDTGEDTEQQTEAVMAAELEEKALQKGHRTSVAGEKDIKENLIYIGNKSQPAIALTFDDGPSNEPTTRILDVLEQYQVKATFFVMGYKAEDYADQLKREKELGCEIGNHSYNHPKLTAASDSKVVKQIKTTRKLVKQVTGEKTYLVRPPYGAYDDRVLSLIKAPAILWSVDTRDWKTRNAEKTVNHVLENVQDGDIVLMHDVYEPTAEAVEQLVPELIKQGYQLVTVSELAALKGETLKKGKVYNRLTAK